VFGVFLKNFMAVNWQLRSIYLAFLAIFVGGAAAISWLENLPFDDALYFSFVTGLTVGYGDISPATGLGRIVALLLALVGMMLTGVLVAVAVEVVKRVFSSHVDVHSR
jgi:voltage-gated potassium channel